jgi:hypothetical protein
MTFSTRPRPAPARMASRSDLHSTTSSLAAVVSATPDLLLVTRQEELQRSRQCRGPRGCVIGIGGVPLPLPGDQLGRGPVAALRGPGHPPPLLVEPAVPEPSPPEELLHDSTSLALTRPGGITAVPTGSGQGQSGGDADVRHQSVLDRYEDPAYSASSWFRRSSSAVDSPPTS